MRSASSRPRNWRGGSVNAGACAALCERGKSLLASGIIRVDGDFDEGELTAIEDDAGREIGRGLVRYGSEDVEIIRGKRSDEISEILGGRPADVVIHRDDMVIL